MEHQPSAETNSGGEERKSAPIDKPALPETPAAKGEEAEGTAFPILPGLEELPPKARTTVQSMVSFMMRSGGPPPEFLEKITSAHISDTIRQVGENSERAFVDRHRCRWFALGYLLVGAAAIIAFCYVIGKTNPSLVKDVLVILLAGAGGLGGGYGWATSKSRRE